MLGLDPKQVDKFYYHAPCTDGSMCAAIALKAGINPHALHAYVHGETKVEILTSGSTVVFADCCPSSKIISTLLDEQVKVYVFDHHKTAMPTLQAFHGRRFFNCSFSLEKCGAQIVWENLFPGLPMPLIVDYVADRDLWKFLLLGSKEVSAKVGLLTIHDLIGHLPELPLLHDRRQEEADRQYRAIEDLKQQGTIILEYQNTQVQRALPRVRIGMFKTLSWRIALLNSTTVVSELGNYLCRTMADEIDFAAIYFDTDRHTKFSLRSIGDFDVSQIAARFGGGGHKNAAGFEIPLGSMSQYFYYLEG